MLNGYIFIQDIVLGLWILIFEDCWVRLTTKACDPEHKTHADMDILMFHFWLKRFIFQHYDHLLPELDPWNNQELAVLPD